MTYDTIKYKHCTIRIETDDNPESPRDWDNLGEMVCWHRHYKLGDDQPAEDPQEWYAAHRDDIAAIRELFLYDHSGLTMQTGPFSCPWDSGPVGYIWMSKERAFKEYSRKKLTKSFQAKLEKILDQEVQTYDDYLTGSVYGFICEGPDGEQIDSCWGFYGYDETQEGSYMVSEAKTVIDSWRANRAKSLRADRQEARAFKAHCADLEAQSAACLIGL